MSQRKPRQRTPRPSPEEACVRITEASKAAYALGCPKCKSRPGEVCVLIGSPQGPYQIPDPRRGKPCDRPHNERYHAVWKKKRTEYGAAYLRDARNARVIANLKALELQRLAEPLRAFDRIEHAQLAAWLKVNGGIFTSL